MGLKRLELLTPALSEQCSNQLSYRPDDSSMNNRSCLNTNSLDSFFKFLMCVTVISGQSLYTHWHYPTRYSRKEVIQPHLPIQLPCYDLAPINSLTFGALFLAVREATSGTAIFHGLTGGVYKARERIHRGMLIRDY